jgi:hypothetical protein
MRDLPAGSLTSPTIEGSIRLPHALGDQDAEVPSDHRHLLRAAFTRHGAALAAADEGANAPTRAGRSCHESYGEG